MCSKKKRQTRQELCTTREHKFIIILSIFITFVSTAQFQLSTAWANSVGSLRYWCKLFSYAVHIRKLVFSYNNNAKKCCIEVKRLLSPKQLCRTHKKNFLQCLIHFKESIKGLKVKNLVISLLCSFDSLHFVFFFLIFLLTYNINLIYFLLANCIYRFKY